MIEEWVSLVEFWRDELEVTAQLAGKLYWAQESGADESLYAAAREEWETSMIKLVETSSKLEKDVENTTPTDFKEKEAKLYERRTRDAIKDLTPKGYDKTRTKKPAELDDFLKKMLDHLEHLNQLNKNFQPKDGRPIPGSGIPKPAVDASGAIAGVTGRTGALMATGGITGVTSSVAGMTSSMMGVFATALGFAHAASGESKPTSAKTPLRGPVKPTPAQPRKPPHPLLPQYYQYLYTWMINEARKISHHPKQPIRLPKTFNQWLKSPK